MIVHVSGQIIATSHDLGPPNGGLVWAECFMYGSHSVAAVHSRLIGIKGELWKNGGLVWEVPLISGKFRLVKYYNLARCIYY